MRCGIICCHVQRTTGSELVKVGYYVAVTRIPTGLKRRRGVDVDETTWDISDHVLWIDGPMALTAAYTLSELEVSRASLLSPYTPRLPTTFPTHFYQQSHSLSFCKQYLYGRYAFAGRKVACQSTSFSCFLLILGYDACRRKTSTTLRGKRRVRSIFLRAKPETLTNAVDKKCAIKQCRARIYVCTPQIGIGLILYVRPTSDSEVEEAKGDSSGAMAPPPVPPAKKVRISLRLSLLGVNAHLFLCSS